MHRRSIQPCAWVLEGSWQGLGISYTLNSPNPKRAYAPTLNRKPRGAASPKHAATYWADMPAYPAQIAEGLGGLGLGFSGLGFKARVYVLGGKYQNIQTYSPTLLQPKH